MCVAPTRAEAEDIAQSVTLEFEELPAVVDMLLACKPDAPLVHDEWSDNRVVEFRKEASIEEIARTADVRIHRHIRTSRHCMFPMEGRGVIGYRDARLRFLTIISSTQFPHCVQTGLCEALNISDGDIRVISPDVGGGFGYKGILQLPRKLRLRGWQGGWIFRFDGLKTAANIWAPMPIAASMTMKSPVMRRRMESCVPSIA